MPTSLPPVHCLRCEHELAQPFDPCPACLAEGVSVNGTTRPRAPGGASVAALAAAHLPTGLEALPPTPLRPLTRYQAGRPLRLFSKDERGGLTSSYKDRLARVVAARAAEAGADTLVLASSGNHGAAVAAAATAAGLRGVVLTMTSIAPPMRRLIEGCGGQLVPVARAEDRWVVVRAAVAELGWFPAGNYHDPPIGSNPYAVDGYQPIAWEIAEQLGRVPDWVAVPIGYGDGISGIAKGFRSLVEAGLSDRVPRMLGVETTGTLRDALERGLDQPEAMPVQAPNALSIACPCGTYQALHAIRSTDGAAVTVDDEGALAARAQLSRREGSFQELSSAAALAGVELAVADGTIAPEATVVAIASSVGLKDQLLPGETDDPLQAVAPTLDGMRSLLEVRADA